MFEFFKLKKYLVLPSKKKKCGFQLAYNIPVVKDEIWHLNPAYIKNQLASWPDDKK